MLITDKSYLCEAQNERADYRQRETETREGQLQSQHNAFMPEQALSTCHNNSLSLQERPNVGELDGAMASLRHLHHQSNDGERAVNGKCSAVPSWRIEDVCYAVPSIYALVSQHFVIAELQDQSRKSKRKSHKDGKGLGGRGGGVDRY